MDVIGEVYCPACGKKMRQIFIPDAKINVDICLDGCGGILFNTHELEKFDEKHENANDILSLIEDKVFEHTDESKTRICTLCGTPMTKIGTNNKDTIEIDRCNVCGARFLDHDELKLIRESIEDPNETKNMNKMVDDFFYQNMKDMYADDFDPTKKESGLRLFVVNFVRNAIFR